MFLFSLVSSVFATAPQYLELPSAERNGTPLRSYLLYNLPDQEWSLQLENQPGAASPVGSYTLGGSASPMPIQPIMTGQNATGSFTEQSANVSNPQMGSSEMPTGQAPVPVTGSAADSSVPQAGSTSGTKKYASTDSSKSKSKTSKKDSDKDKKNSAKSVGILATLLAVSFCFLAV